MEYTIRQRMEALRKQGDRLPKELTRIAKTATMRAVETATDLTPPTTGNLSGTNTRSGEMKQQWAASSETAPQVSGNRYTTWLKNNANYSSYVNDGHRMDRHFVPGLVINDAGRLEYNPDGTGGMVVGTRTSYVEGLFMVDRALQAYRETVDREIEILMKEVGK